MRILDNPHAPGRSSKRSFAALRLGKGDRAPGCRNRWFRRVSFRLPEHDLSGFDCGEPALNARLKSRALRNESRFSRTYVACEDDRVIAYYCVSAGSVERAHAPGKISPQRARCDSGLGNRPARGRPQSLGRGLGADILADALRRIAAASQTIGIAAVLVHAKDEAAKRSIWPAPNSSIFGRQPHPVSADRNAGRRVRLIAGIALDLLKALQIPRPCFGGEAARLPLPDDQAMFEHVDAVRVRQGEGHVLFAEQHRDVRRLPEPLERL